MHICDLFILSCKCYAHHLVDRAEDSRTASGHLFRIDRADMSRFYTRVDVDPLILYNMTAKTNNTIYYYAAIE